MQNPLYDQIIGNVEGAHGHFDLVPLASLPLVTSAKTQSQRRGTVGLKLLPVPSWRKAVEMSPANLKAQGSGPSLADLLKEVSTGEKAVRGGLVKFEMSDGILY